MRTLRVLVGASLTFTSLIFLAGCGGGGASYSLLGSGQTFTQSNNSFNNQLDILWVVDDSSSMQPLQTEMNSNFTSFIQNFQTLGYDFRMAVTSTDAYKGNKSFTQYQSSFASLANFKNAVTNGTGSSTLQILTSALTPSVLDTDFVNNATTGINGSGDERALSSIMTAMNNTSNPAFLRSTSFFAVIILSDEDDFSNYNRTEDSWGGNDALDHCYANSTMDAASSMGTPSDVQAYAGTTHASQCAGTSTPPDSINSYVSGLDTLTQSTGATRRWNVSAITILDPTCQATHYAQTNVAIIGQRYIQMVQATNGIQGSICDATYANSLANIASNIATLSTQFFLTQVPQVSTIVITVNGNLIAQSPTNGWQYNATNNSIMFYGTAIPPQGAQIGVNFIPQSIN